MLTFGKTGSVAVAAMSYLAELSSSGKAASAAGMAKARGLPVAHVSKVMGRLSAAGLVVGEKGPGGGYRLARPPREISVLDILSIFDQSRLPILCPFGPNWCGLENPCPWHDRMVALQEENKRAMGTMTLDAFVGREGGP